MSDIFISYARSSLGAAETVAAALRSRGYGVWRDDEIPPHRPYADVIRERLEAAKAVVVLWSEDAARSTWVRSEAESARASAKLVQTTVDGATLPMPFDQIECADLVGWSGDPSSPGWAKVLGSLAELIGRPSPRVASVGSDDAPPAAATRPSICVLPFANMSGDPEQAYFSDGVTEDVITDLGKVSSLFVVSRDTAFAFRGDAREAARRLGVRYVLTGSVRKAGGRVRITAQLVDGVSGGQLWGDRYDRDLDDIFALQDEISHAIVSELKIQLSPSEREALSTRGTANAQAHDLYMMARREYVNGVQGDREWGPTMERLCRRALELDPHYAAAWALLALARVADGYIHGLVSDGAEAVAQALALDPHLADAHAVEARILSSEGRHGAASDEAALAVRLDPASWLTRYSAGVVALEAGRHAEAVAAFEAAAALDPADFVSVQLLMNSLDAAGDGAGARRAAESALDRVRRVLDEQRNNAFAMAVGASALALLGRAVEARDQLQRALLVDPDNVIVRCNGASVLASLGDVDEAAAMLAPAATHMGAGLLSLVKTSSPAALRGHGRFQSLVAEAEARLAARPAR